MGVVSPEAYAFIFLIWVWFALETLETTEWSLFISEANQVIQVYAPTANAEEAEQFYEDLQDLLELTLKKKVLFIIGDWNAKVESQEILE